MDASSTIVGVRFDACDKAIAVRYYERFVGDESGRTFTKAGREYALVNSSELRMVNVSLVEENPIVAPCLFAIENTQSTYEAGSRVMGYHDSGFLF